MNFKEYIKNKIEETHGEIIKDIKDIDEDIKFYRMTRNDFYIKIYNDDLYWKLFYIAKNHGYRMGFFEEEKDTCLMFVKEHIVSKYITI